MRSLSLATDIQEEGLGKAWSELPVEERRHYQQRAQKVEKEHNMKYPDYQYEPRPKYYKLLKKGSGDSRRVQDRRQLGGPRPASASPPGRVPSGSAGPPAFLMAADTPSPPAAPQPPSTPAMMDREEDDCLVWVPCHSSFAEKLGWSVPLLPKVDFSDGGLENYELRGDGILAPLNRNSQGACPETVISLAADNAQASHVWTAQPIAASQSFPFSVFPVASDLDHAQNTSPNAADPDNAGIGRQPLTPVHIVKTPDSAMAKSQEQGGTPGHVQMYKVPHSWSNLPQITGASMSAQMMSFQQHAAEATATASRVRNQPDLIKNETVSMQKQALYLTSRSGTVGEVAIPLGSHPILAEDQGGDNGNQVTLLVGAIEDPNCKEITIKLQAYSSGTSVEELLDPARGFPDLGKPDVLEHAIPPGYAHLPLVSLDAPWAPGLLLGPRQQPEDAESPSDPTSDGSQTSRDADVGTAGWDSSPDGLPDSEDTNEECAPPMLGLRAFPRSLEVPTMMQASSRYSLSQIQDFRLLDFHGSPSSDDQEEECRQAVRFLDSQASSEFS